MLVSAFSYTRNTPCIRLLVLVVQRLETQLFLVLRQFDRVGEMEKAGRKLDQPTRVDGGGLAHVFLGGEHNLVVDNPLGLSVEQSRGWMNVGHSAVHQRAVTFLWVLLRSVSE